MAPPRRGKGALTRQDAVKVLKEVERRQRQGQLLDHLFASQSNFVNDPSRLKAALCTRRAGKSYGVGAYLLSEALNNPGCTVLYVALTRESAKRIMFKDVLKVLDRKHGLNARFNEVDLSVRFANGSVLYLVGADTNEKHRERLHGQKYRLVVIDEAGLFRTDLEELVYGTLKPAVADQRGTICLVGTPRNHKSFFYQVTTGAEPGWSVHRWSAHDNPHMAEQWAAEIEDFRQKNPRFLETPKFKQEYLGEWVVDDTALVYRYRADLNVVAELPSSRRGYHHVLGIDLGFTDATAWVVCAFSPHDPTLYVVHAEKEAGLTVSRVAERTQRLIDAFNPYCCVVDTASRQSVEELRQTFALPLEPAEKRGKAEAIARLNDDLAEGKVKALPGANDLLEEWDSLVWDERLLRSGRRAEHPGCDNHLSDAMLYAWRESQHYAATEEPKRPRRGGEEWMDEWFERERRRVEAENRGDDDQVWTLEDWEA